MWRNTTRCLSKRSTKAHVQTLRNTPRWSQTSVYRSYHTTMEGLQGGPSATCGAPCAGAVGVSQRFAHFLAVGIWLIKVSLPDVHAVVISATLPRRVHSIGAGF